MHMNKFWKKTHFLPYFWPHNEQVSAMEEIKTRLVKDILTRCVRRAHWWDTAVTLPLRVSHPWDILRNLIALTNL